MDETGELGFSGLAVESKGACLGFDVSLGVVGALQQVALPGRDEEGLRELAVRGHILEDAPTRSSETPAHDAQLGHCGEEPVDILWGDAVLDQDQDGAIVGADVLTYGKRRAGDQL